MILLCVCTYRVVVHDVPVAVMDKMHSNCDVSMVLAVAVVINADELVLDAVSVDKSMNNDMVIHNLVVFELAVFVSQL